ncbi:unnamed protein product [Amoebophrya sp. A120]|nr:unnamed protein product [Amoebophrya sp. A120]|eukprot:GSA120T00023650001.1
MLDGLRRMAYCRQFLSTTSLVLVNSGIFGEPVKAPICKPKPLANNNLLIVISRAIFNESIPFNILSVSILLQKGFRFSTDLTKLFLPGQEKKSVSIHRFQNGLFYVVFHKNTSKEEHTCLTYSYEDHCRSAHILPYRGFCQSCTISRAAKAPHRAGPRDDQYEGRLTFNDEISTDLCGPILPESIHGHKFAMTIADKKTRLPEVAPLRRKADSVNGLRLWIAKHTAPRRLKSDNGGEFISERFRAECRANRIVQVFTSYYSSPMNGGAEVLNKLALAGTRTLIADSGLPKKLWCYAIKHYVFCLSIMPRKCLNGSNSHREAYGEDFDTAKLLRFGEEIFYNTKPQGKTVDNFYPRRRLCL